MSEHEYLYSQWVSALTAPREAYGLWTLVIINAAVFIVFVFSLATPRTKRDWRSFGAFSAFLIALFAEMYGFPLTIYLLSGWLGNRYPQIDFLTHDAGHLLEVLFGWGGNPHFGPFHVASYLLIGAGFILLARSWGILYEAQRRRELATSGPYAYVRHPQYVGFVLIMAGFLLQWPTLVTLLMFPILAWMYVRLAHREEQEIRAIFAGEYDRYAARTPRFFPRMRSPSASAAHAEGSNRAVSMSILCRSHA